MRITDFLGPHLDGVSRVVERHSGSLSLEPYLSLPEHITYERSRDPAPRRGRSTTARGTVGGEVLLLTLLGPDEARFGREDDALESLAGLGPGQRAAVVIGYPTPALPVHRLLDALGASGSQLVQLSSLEHQHLHAAAMAVHLGRDVALPRDPFGQPIAATTPDDSQVELMRRLANEFVLLDFVARNLRAQVFRLGGSSVEGPDALRRRDELERWTEQARAQAEQARVDAEAAKADAQLARAETEAVRTEADALRHELVRLHGEIDRVSTSTSFLVGRRIVETARHPTSTPRLPIDLVRLWRRRGRAVDTSKPAGGAKKRQALTVPPAPAPAARPAAPLSPIRATVAIDDQQRRFSAHLALEARPRTRPVIAGILTDSTAGALTCDATVNRINPNDARVIVERTEPDILLVETAALGAGRPWAFVGDPSATDRTARLMELIDLVHALGNAAVLVRDAFQPVPGLIPLEPRFDLVLDAGAPTSQDRAWSRGVQLARFHPLNAPASRDRVPLLVGGWSTRGPVALRGATAAAMAAFKQYGLEVRADPDGAIDELDSIGLTSDGSPWLTWRDAPAVYRARAVAVANPFTVPAGVGIIEPRLLEQLACGTTIVSGRNLALTAGFGPFVHTVSTPADVAAAVSDALADQPRSTADTRSLLRTLFEGHATPVMLAALTHHFPSIPDPLIHRGVAAVVAGAPTNRPSLVDSLIDQRFRPRQVALDEDGRWSAGERDALEASGIATRLFDNGAEAGWSAIGSLASTDWLAVWPTDRPVVPTYLIDLAAGAEMSPESDIVGYGPEPLGGDDGVGLGAAIVRRSPAASALVGRALAGDGAMPSATGDASLRALSIGPEEHVP
jgi:hypothetical protein